MSRATAVVNRLGTVLKKVNASSFFIYKRSVIRKGGDPLLGRPGSVEYVDKLIDPPPIYQRISKNLVGNSSLAELFEVGGAAAIGNDYQITFSSAAITINELNDTNLLIVFKDSRNNEESFTITDFEPISFEGIDVIIVAYIKSTQRPTK